MLVLQAAVNVAADTRTHVHVKYFVSMTSCFLEGEQLDAPSPSGKQSAAEPWNIIQSAVARLRI